MTAPIEGLPCWGLGDVLFWSVAALSLVIAGAVIFSGAGEIIAATTLAGTLGGIFGVISGLALLVGPTLAISYYYQYNNVMSDILKQVAITLFVGGFATLGALIARRFFWAEPRHSAEVGRRAFRVTLIIIWSAAILLSIIAYLSFH